MKRTLTIALVLALTFGSSGVSRAAGPDDDLKFFEDEAQVVSASLKPSSIREAPATVYVVTSAEIKASGAQTIWDALRTVPGVDVMETRANQAEVSIRGLNKALNNRTLVLLDGKTLLNGFYDSITWESIPVTMEEIDRIEVVEGPASALYGANAVSGVINIITKTPEQLKGGVVSYAGGTANSHSGTALYGNRAGSADYKLGLGESVSNGFQDESKLSSQAGKLHASAGYDFSSDSRLNVSGGLTNLNTQTTTGSPGTAFDEGYVGFLRADYNYKQTALRAFLNQGQGVDHLSDLSQPNPSYVYSTFDLNLQHAMTLPFGQDLVVGGSYRRNAMESSLLQPGPHAQDLWSLFFEDQWKPLERWTFAASGRLDRHPLTPLSFSPHGSAIFAPTDWQSFRLSAGTSFRNPTLLENYLEFSQILPNPGVAPLTNPPFTTIQTQVSGNRGLDQERMFQVELAHDARFGPVQTTAAVFYYSLRNQIQTSPALVSAVPPTVGVQSSYFNHGGTKAVGFELGGKAHPRSWLDLFANYSYQSLKDDDPSTQAVAPAAPKNKVNAGFTTKRRGLTTSLWSDWVSATEWTLNQQGTPTVYAKVPDYLLLNGRVGYAFSGRWDGWELALSGFNMLDRAHYEILPAASPLLPGQNGEIVRSRWTGTAAYRF